MEKLEYSRFNTKLNYLMNLLWEPLMDCIPKMIIPKMILDSVFGVLFAYFNESMASTGVYEP